MTAHPFRRAVFELLVVVLGILIAFRVDEWKDHRAEQREIAASLTRLAGDFVANQQACNSLTDDILLTRDAVWHVYSSLQAGRILGDDADLFEQGLINADFIPQIPISVPAYEEMIATGRLRSLEDAALAGELARLRSEIEMVRLQIPHYRLVPSELAAELRSLADFRYAESPDEPRVSYDFAALVGSRKIRNLYFEAVDSHGDLAFHVTRVCDLVRRIDARLSDSGLQVRGQSDRGDSPPLRPG